MTFYDDPFNNLNLFPATKIQEDIDYKILNEQCFDYLYKIYGGQDIRRVSQPQAKEDEYSVEVHLRKINIHIVPQMTYFPTL